MLFPIFNSSSTSVATTTTMMMALMVAVVPLAVVVDGSSDLQQVASLSSSLSIDTPPTRSSSSSSSSFEELVVMPDHHHQDRHRRRQQEESLKLRCGACWCIAVDEPNGGQCPTDTTGITDFSSSEQLELSELYLKFDLDNPREPFLELSPRSADDGSVACYPFADAVGTQVDYAEANFPQCTKPTTSDGAVCAYLYDISSETCVQRSYDVYTYESAQQATSNGAEIVHGGGTCTVQYIYIYIFN